MVTIKFDTTFYVFFYFSHIQYHRESIAIVQTLILSFVLEILEYFG